VIHAGLRLLQRREADQFVRLDALRGVVMGIVAAGQGKLLDGI
jgi:hypothetical protein